MGGRELWFERAEFDSRVARARAGMREHGVDVLLAFHPASVTWLTGFFTTAYMLFSVAIVPARGDPLTVCRDNEEYWLRRTGAFEPDFAGSTAKAAIRRRSSGGRCARQAPRGRGSASSGFLAGNGAARDDPGGAAASHVRGSRRGRGGSAARDQVAGRDRVHPEGSRAVEAATAAGIDATRAGVTERDVAAAISSALILSGSDVAGPGPMGSGERARHLHATFEDRVLQRGDTVVLEVDGCVHHYYSRFFRTILVGQATAEERALATKVLDLQDRAWAEVRPGAPVATADRILRSGIETLTGRPYTNNSFGSIGLTLFPPAPALLAVATSDWSFEAGQAFHSYAKVDTMFFSETILVTDEATNG